MSEDAAALLADFVQSLDNLPSEVKHYLGEIEQRDGQVGELCSRAMNRQIAVQRHFRAAATSSSSSSSSYSSADAKEAALEEKARSELEDAISTTREKVVLARRARDIVQRHFTKLQAEIDKLEAVTSLVVPHMEVRPLSTAAAVSASAGGHAGLSGATMTPTGTNLLLNGSDGIQSGGILSSSRLPSPALGRLDGNAAALDAAGTPTASNKKRKHAPPGAYNGAALAHSSAGGPPGSGGPSGIVGAHAATGLRSSAGGIAASSPLAYANSSSLSSSHGVPQGSLPPPAITTLKGTPNNASQNKNKATSNQSLKRNRKQVGKYEEEEDDEDDDQDGAEDQKPYCSCRQVSFGEMIACDNDDCPYEWFHYSCVGLKSALPDKTTWYCPFCRDKMANNNQKNSRTSARR